MENLVAYTFYDVDEEFISGQPITSIVKLSKNFIIYTIEKGEDKLALKNLRIQKVSGVDFYSLNTGDKVDIKKLKIPFNILCFNEVIYSFEDIVDDIQLERFTIALKNGKVKI